MKLVKKASVIATAAAVLMSLGVSSAMAVRNPEPDPDNDNKKVTICHRTKSAKNPYREITISENAWKNGKHGGHSGDFVAPADGCPDGPGPGPGPDPDPDHDHDHDDADCSAKSTSGDSKSDQRGLVNVGNVGLNLGNLGANALCQSNILNGLTAGVLGTAVGGDFEGGSDDGECSAKSTSGDSKSDQKGLVNVGNVDVNGGNLLANAACQSDILNGLTAAVLGKAVGGDFEGGSGGDCSAKSETDDSKSDQKGLVNVGNVGVNGGNAAANLLCQSNILNDATLAVLGFAGHGGHGGHDGHGGLLDGGLLGLLDVDGGLLAKIGLFF